MIIAVLSDSHGYLKPEVISGIKGVEHIIHAGDFDNRAILNKLVEIAPVTCVRGNCDVWWGRDLPETASIECEGVKIFVIHDKWRISGDISDYDIVIYGHSHQYSEERRNGQTWFNPGSCGNRRYDPYLTYAVLTIENGEFSFERRNIVI